MPHLVTTAPDRRVHRLDEAGLKAYVKAHDIPGKLAGNLRQLLGFDVVGRDRKQRKEASDYYNLRDATWLYHPEVATAAVLFGSNPVKLEMFKERYHPTATCSLATFEKLVSGKRTVDGWCRGTAPNAVSTLADGSSVFGLPAEGGRPTSQPTSTSSCSLPDYAGLGVGAQSSVPAAACNKLLVEKDGNGKEKPPELVHVTVGALVQEHGLCFERDFGYHRESILSNESHLRIMSHIAFLGNVR